QRLQKLLDEQKQLEKQLRDLEARVAKTRAQDLAASAKTVSGMAVLSARLDGLDAEGLRSVMDTLRERMGSGIICLGSAMDGKVPRVVSVSRDLPRGTQAGKVIQEIAPLVGGKGGGRPDLAQGGGSDVSRLDEVLARVPALVERLGTA